MVIKSEGFDKEIAKLTYSPTSEQGTGFLAPFVRGIGHLLYVVGAGEEGKEPAILKDELGAAYTHWKATTPPSDAMSKDSLKQFAILLVATESAVNEIAAWNKDTLVTNVRNLVNRALQFAANLDRELIGLVKSDPGSSL